MFRKKSFGVLNLPQPMRLVLITYIIETDYQVEGRIVSNEWNR